MGIFFKESVALTDRLLTDISLLSYGRSKDSNYIDFLGFSIDIKLPRLTKAIWFSISSFSGFLIKVLTKDYFLSIKLFSLFIIIC